VKKENHLLRVGVLGAGLIAQAAHLEACKKARNVELYALCDAAPDLLGKVASFFEPTKAYGDYAALLADKNVDAVVIAIADQFHVPMASRAIEAGKGALAISAQAGVRLAIEPGQANVICDASRARMLLDSLRAGAGLKVILDPANLLQEGLPQRDILQEAFDLLGADLAIAHAKDRRSDGEVCALGRGIVDFETYFGMLYAVGFAGPVIMHGFEEAEALESTRFARARLQEAKADAVR